MECNYTHTDIDKILGFKTWNNKKKIDTLLHIDCRLYANLGSDSTKSEKQNVNKTSKSIYKAIKSIDNEMGNLFLRALN